MGTGSIPGVKCCRGVLLTTHPLLVPQSWKNRAITLPTLWATPGLTRYHFTLFYEANINELCAHIDFRDRHMVNNTKTLAELQFVWMLTPSVLQSFADDSSERER